MEPQRYLRRKAASKYLFENHGIARAPSTLAKYAVIGGGPVFQLMGRDPVYTPVNLDQWVASKMSSPMRSTSERAPLAAEAAGKHCDHRSANHNSADEKSKGQAGAMIPADGKVDNELLEAKRLERDAIPQCARN